MKEKAVICEDFNPLSDYVRNKPKDSTNRSGKKADNSNTKSVPSGSGGSASKATTSKPGSAGGSEASKRKLSSCLFPGCKENHLVRDHPGVNEEQTKTYVEEYKRKKAAEKEKS